MEETSFKKERKLKNVISKAKTNAGTKTKT